MSTKQQRISDAAQIKSRLGQLVGKKINLVLRNNTTQTGSVEMTTDSTVVVKNLRLKKFTYPFNDIAEIYFDTIV
jgi:hypothetical protein